MIRLCQFYMPQAVRLSMVPQANSWNSLHGPGVRVVALGAFGAGAALALGALADISALKVSAISLMWLLRFLRVPFVGY